MGNTILGVVIIDDVLDIVILTIIISFSSSDIKISSVLLKIVLFFVFIILACSLFHLIFKNWLDKDATRKRRYVIATFAFCLLLSYISEVNISSYITNGEGKISRKNDFLDNLLRKLQFNAKIMQNKLEFKENLSYNEYK